MSALPFVRTDIITKIDNAMLIDIFSAWAGAMHTSGVLGMKETNALRVSLNELQCYEPSDEYPTLLQLIHNDSEFISILFNRFGEMNLCRNIFRLTVVRSMQRTISDLNVSAKEMLPKIALLFNRPLMQYIDNSCENVTLFSSVLLDYIETIEQASIQMQRCCQQLSSLIGSDNPGDQALDLEFARSVGFEQIEAPSVFLSNDSIAMFDYAGGLMRYLRSSREFVEILRRNQAAPKKTSRISLLIENVELQVEAIAKISYPHTRDAESWESKRVSTIVCIHAINESLHELCHQMNQLIAAHAGKHETNPVIISMQVRRQIVTRLIRAGLDPKESAQATEDLVNYCNNNNLMPSSLILGELRKINSFFNEDIFNYLQSTDQDFALQNHRSHEKHKNVDRVNRLAKVFAEL